MSSDTPWQSPSGPEDSGARPTEPRFGAYGTPAAGQPSAPSPSYGTTGPQAPGAYPQAGGAPATPVYPSYPGAAPQGTPSFLVAPKPGIIPLRPLSITEVIGGAFESLRANPKAMFVPAIVVMAVIGLISALHTFFTSQTFYSAVESTGDNPYLSPEQATGLMYDSLGAMSSYLLTTALTAIASTILTGLLIVAVSRSVLGRVAGPGEVWQRTKGRVWALIGQTILVSLIVGAVTVVVGLLALIVFATLLGPLFGGAEPSGSSIAVAVIILIVLGVVGAVLSIFLGVRMSLSSAALVLENVGVIEGIKRSWALTRGNFWRVLGTMLLAALITAVATGVLSGITGTLSGLAAVLVYGGALPAISAASAFIGSLVSAVILPFSAAVTALIYIDLRMRQEGLDVELRQAAGTL